MPILQMRKSRHKEVKQLATRLPPGKRLGQVPSVTTLDPCPLLFHSKYLGGGRGCGRLPQSQRVPQAGSTSLLGDETVAGSNGAGASLEAVGIREQRSAPQRSEAPLAHKSGGQGV